MQSSWISKLLLAVSGVYVSLPIALAGVHSPLSASSGMIQRQASDSSKACNNSPDLCSKAYNQITYMGAHDSAFLSDKSNDNSVAGNQFLNATDALDAGLRFLQAQFHEQNNTLRLCHTSCGILDAGSLEDWLSKIAYWMGTHPNDVVTLLLVNSDKADISQVASAFQGSGLSKFAYSPASAGPTTNWPTLESMIDKNTRLVSFITNIGSGSSATPYLIPEFDYIFETAYEVTDLQGFNCTVDRPGSLESGSGGDAIAKGYMSLVNHFLNTVIIGSVTTPAPDSAATVNSAGTSRDGNLGKQLQQCKSEWNNHAPNFVLVDFWNKGQTVQAADALNSISDATGRTSGDSSAGGDDDGDSMGNPQARSYGHCALLAFVAAALIMV